MFFPLIFGQEALKFHFALCSTNFIASPGHLICTIMLIKKEKEEKRQKEEKEKEEEDERGKRKKEDEEGKDNACIRKLILSQHLLSVKQCVQVLYML